MRIATAADWDILAADSMADPGAGLIGAGNDPSVLSVVGIPKSVDAVVPMPSAPVMERILEALGAASAAG